MTTLPNLKLIDPKYFYAEEIQELKEVSFVQNDLKFQRQALYERFDFDLKPFNDEDAELLCEEMSLFLNKIEKLQIIITDDDFQQEYLQLFGQKISKCQNLKNLNVCILDIKHKPYDAENDNEQENDYVAFSKQISQCKNLEILDLDLEEGYIDDEICLKMLRNIVTLPQLSQLRLNLAENPYDVEQDDWRQLVKIISKIKKLNYLNIAFAGEQTSKFMNKLRTIFKRKMKQLVYLNLHWLD